MNKVNLVQKDTQDIIRKTIEKAVDMVKPTYGPSSSKVIIKKMTHQLVVDDGVQIMRDLEFNDPNENAVLSVIREVAIRTNDRAGDGTTGSMIMLSSIMKAAYDRPSRAPYHIVKELNSAVEEAKEQLEKSSIKIKSKEDLVKVARISFDDYDIAELIADTVFKMGQDGIVTVDRSSDMQTKADITEGITMDRGYVSPYMVTNPQTLEAVIEKPYILLTDYRLTEANDVVGVMNLLLQKNIHNLVVICDTIESGALATAIINKMQGKFNLVAINLPSGDRQNMLEDLAILVGGTVFSEKKGNRIENATITDLGRADRFIASGKESVLIGPRGKKDNIKQAIENLTSAYDIEKDENIKKSIKKRIATFSGKVAVIKVGAKTENEEKALRYKVEDAVNAVQVAFKGGVVCGAGLALSRIKTSSEILNEALQAPFKQLKINMGIDRHIDLKKDEALNAVTGEVGNFLKIGVVDPVQVLIAGIESAVSIATVLLTSKGMVVEVPPQPKE